MADRERVGRDASPSAAIIDSQSVKATEAGGPPGYDAGKKNGRKHHALVDTDGRGLVLEPHPASIQDRDGGGSLLRLRFGSRCGGPPERGRCLEKREILCPKGWKLRGAILVFMLPTENCAWA